MSRRRPRRTKSRCGVTLLETMISAALVGTIMSLALSSYVSLYKLTRSNTARLEMLQAASELLRLLRTDIMLARSAAVSGDATLTLVAADGAKIVYEFLRARGSVVRRGNGRSEVVAESVAALTFVSSSSSSLVRISLQMTGKRAAEIRTAAAMRNFREEPR